MWWHYFESENEMSKIIFGNWRLRQTTASSHVVTQSVFGDISLHDLVTSCFILKPWLSSFGGHFQSSTDRSRGGESTKRLEEIIFLQVNFLPWWTELRLPSPQSGESARCRWFPRPLVIICGFIAHLQMCLLWPPDPGSAPPGFIAATTAPRDDARRGDERWRRRCREMKAGQLTETDGQAGSRECGVDGRKRKQQ